MEPTEGFPSCHRCMQGQLQQSYTSITKRPHTQDSPRSAERGAQDSMSKRKKIKLPSAVLLLWSLPTSCMLSAYDTWVNHRTHGMCHLTQILVQHLHIGGSVLLPSEDRGGSK